MSSPRVCESESDETTTQIAIRNEDLNRNQEDPSQNRIMSPTPTIHVLHDIHDDDVQMINEYDRKSGLIRQNPNLQQQQRNIIMSPTATTLCTATSPSPLSTTAGGHSTSVQTVLLKRQYSNTSNSSAEDHLIQYQRSHSISHELPGFGTNYSLFPATRRASAFTPYTNPYHGHHRGSIASTSTGFSGHGSSSVSSPLSTSSRHSITPPTVPTPTPTPMNFAKSPNSASAGAVANEVTMCSLKWDNYEHEMVDCLTSLYKSEEWADVTLSCEGHTIKAHKVILSMCSPFFRKMFQESPCKHPHVIVNGMKRREFERVIHFIYNGSVHINPDELDDFLDAAETLKIDGVDGNGSSAAATAAASMAKSPAECEGEDDSSSTYTHHLLRHRHHSDGSDQSLPAPFERLHLEEEDRRPHTRPHQDNFERDGRTSEDSHSPQRKDSEPRADELDKDQHYPLNRLPKFLHKYRRRIDEEQQRKFKESASGEAGHDEKRSNSGGRERRSTSSSISSGDTVVSSKTMLEQAMEVGADGMRGAHGRFEQISSPDSPNLVVEEIDAPSPTKSLRLDLDNDVGADEPASPVDMSVGTRASVLGPRPPPPPWYSPPSSQKSHHDSSSQRSFHSSDEDSAVEEHGSVPSLASHSPRSPASVIASTSRASHVSHRHSLSHIYPGGQVGASGYSGDETFMRRSLSLSPPENQSYQLHLTEQRPVKLDEYNELHSNASSRRNLVPPGTHLEDRRWMIPQLAATSMGKRTHEIPTSGLQRYPHAEGSLNIPFRPSFQFHTFGSPAYPNSQVVATAPTSSRSPRPDGGFEQNYASYMERAGAFGLNKYRFKTTNANIGAASQLRMQLSGMGNHSGVDSLGSVGSSPRASSASSSASIGAAGSGQPQASGSSMANSSHRPTLGMNHSLSSLTKPRTKAIRSCQVPQEFRYTAQEVDSMVERVENYPGPLVPCAVCAKFVKRERLRAHIHECHLLQGEKIICQYCGIALKSKGSYRVHIWRHKRGNLPTKKFKPGASGRRPSASQ